MHEAVQALAHAVHEAAQALVHAAHEPAQAPCASPGRWMLRILGIPGAGGPRIAETAGGSKIAFCY